MRCRRAASPKALAQLMGLRTLFRGAQAAVAFLTRVPVGGFPFKPDEMGWAIAWFPAVGLGIGAVQYVVWRLFGGLDPLATATLTVGMGALLTGALHEDGLADTADALGGASSREAVFRILKDSRIGTYGAVALIMSFTTRIVLLAEVGGRAATALLAAHCVSRLPPVWLLAALPYVTPEEVSKSRQLVHAGTPQVIVATCWVLAFVVTVGLREVLTYGRCLALGGVTVGVAICAGAFFRQRAGGVTGDFLGATQQVAEIGILFVFAAG